MYRGLAALPVGGAGLSAMPGTAASHPLCGTDGIGEQLEELQLTLGQGPCVDAFLHGSAVLTPDPLTGELRHRWAVFADAAVEAGARALFAPPLRMGAISPGERSSRRSTVLDEQLQTALNGRVLIEQAKGKLAERRGIYMEQAFTALRGYARSRNRRLSDVARAFIDDSEPLPGLGA
ncbi:ANTAR domain-containing response regulator [Streptomyces olivochromogenes]|uniref:Transcriptional regulator n=1 Tax=Streptomyces olivochromogenes TaxID=1963 RepID=A0A250V3J5_STROL|nr:ANTAR domain-containing protein [Streptomyces olivochromogenes]KUN48963.1 hypothetical protein AQJ27_04755 [Streptomyces olivochromogenes]GAX48761.1 transcriptional regulator [Streptomyces olivochromogenes]